MTRKYWLDLGPSLLIATAIVVSTLIAALAGRSGWLVLASPLLLALAAVGADVLNSRLQGHPSGPSRASLILGGAFLLAGWIVAQSDPALVKTLIPVSGVSAWVTLLPRSGRRRKPCRSSSINS